MHAKIHMHATTTKQTHPMPSWPQPLTAQNANNKRRAGDLASAWRRARVRIAAPSTQQGDY